MSEKLAELHHQKSVFQFFSEKPKLWQEKVIFEKGYHKRRISQQRWRTNTNLKEAACMLALTCNWQISC